MQRWATRAAMLAGAALAAGALAGCGGEPAPVPTIGSPSPSATAPTETADRAAQLAEEWELTGVPLPADWPDVPVPRGSEVVTAYAIGVEPRRTWTATFTADRGTALDLAEPVVAELRARGYVPIAEYVGEATTNTGLYSFAASSFAVYVVLGEDDGRPNVVITVRGSADPSAGLPTGPATQVPGATISPAPGATGAAPGGTTAPEPSARSASPSSPAASRTP
jgi:hypothetical protein